MLSGLYSFYFTTEEKKYTCRVKDASCGYRHENFILTREMGRDSKHNSTCFWRGQSSSMLHNLVVKITGGPAKDFSRVVPAIHFYVYAERCVCFMSTVWTRFEKYI